MIVQRFEGVDLSHEPDRTAVMIVHEPQATCRVDGPHEAVECSWYMSARCDPADPCAACGAYYRSLD